MSTGDIDRDGNTGAARLGTGNRGHGALSKPLGLEGAIDSALVVRRGWGGRCRADKWGSRLLHGGDRALGGLRRGFVGVRGCSGRGVRHRAGDWAVGVEDELFDRHNLLAIAKFLQLAQHGLDLLNEGFALHALQLSENFL